MISFGNVFLAVFAVVFGPSIIGVRSLLEDNRGAL